MEECNPVFKKGDLIIDETEREIGILLQKHKVMRYNDNKSDRHYWAWRILWTTRKKTTAKQKWHERLEKAKAEQDLILAIESGTVRHFSK